jgi:uncharacterized protein (DUF2147 family)
MKNYFLLAFFFVSCLLSANDILGKWKTIDDETGEVKSIVEIYEKNGKYYGKVIQIMNKARQDAKCDKCTGAKKNKPVLGLEIIVDMKKDDNEFTGGKILDPESGKEYKCNISFETKNKLKVRGYIGFSLIGRTQYWHKI